MSKLKERMAAGGCRACLNMRSERSTVFCDVHLEQATRYQHAKAAREKGKSSNHTWVSDDVREKMRVLRRSGWTLKMLAESFGYSMTTAHRHVRGVKKAKAA